MLDFLHHTVGSAWDGPVATNFADWCANQLAFDGAIPLTA